MKIQFTQIYIEPGVKFRFTHHLQAFLRKELTRLVVPSPEFIAKYGFDFTVVFYISAKTKIERTEIRGPNVYKKDKDVEHTIFLPFDVIMREEEPSKVAIQYLLCAVRLVLESLKLETIQLASHQDSIIAGICANPIMFE